MSLVFVVVTMARLAATPDNVADLFARTEAALNRSDFTDANRWLDVLAGRVLRASVQTNTGRRTYADRRAP
jgi:hypothetical protein